MSANEFGAATMKSKWLGLEGPEFKSLLSDEVYWAIWS